MPAVPDAVANLDPKQNQGRESPRGSGSEDEFAAPPSSSAFDHDSGDVVCQGYLRKIRGWGQNRSRWFQLTTKALSFYTKDSGERIASCLVKDISAIKPENTTNRFEITSSVPFGRTQNTQMTLEAATPKVKERWLAALAVAKEGTVSDEQKLCAEGYMTKMQTALDKMNRTRWFVCSLKSLAYFTEEGGELMSFCELENVDKVVVISDVSFEVVAKKPFTKSGASEMTLQCRDMLERDRWLSELRRAAPGKVRASAYTPLTENVRSDDDHFGVVIGKSQSAKYLEAQNGDAEESQGNRFISNDDL